MATVVENVMRMGAAGCYWVGLQANVKPEQR